MWIWFLYALYNWDFLYKQHWSRANTIAKETNGLFKYKFTHLQQYVFFWKSAILILKTLAGLGRINRSIMMLTWKGKFFFFERFWLTMKLQAIRIYCYVHEERLLCRREEHHHQRICSSEREKRWWTGCIYVNYLLIHSLFILKNAYK